MHLENARNVIPPLVPTQDLHADGKETKAVEERTSFVRRCQTLGVL